jgi:hypothetical protein
MDKEATHVRGKVTEGRKDAELITPREETIEGRGRQLTNHILGLDETVERQGKSFKPIRYNFASTLKTTSPLSNMILWSYNF